MTNKGLITTDVGGNDGCCPPSNKPQSKDCYPPCEHNHDNLYYRKQILDSKLDAIGKGSNRSIYFEEEEPNPGDGKLGDIWVDISNDVVFEKYEGGWLERWRIESSGGGAGTVKVLRIYEYQLGHYPEEWPLEYKVATYINEMEPPLEIRPQDLKWNVVVDYNNPE